ncbi:hypothetical protein EBZ39_09790 [bacterium]|nr:hypothetical protein [bacterium]
MGVKISQLPSVSLDQNAVVPAVAGSTTGKVRLADIASLTTKQTIGLSNVDNTSDADKPVSTATQNALDLKAPLANPTFTGTVGGISKSMVGLGNVDNTSDADKPVSTAQAAADAAVQSAAASDATAKANSAQAYAVQRSNHTGTQNINTVEGLQAALDSKQPSGSYAILVNGFVPPSQLPSFVDDVLEYADLQSFPANGEGDKIYIALNSNKTYRWGGSSYVQIQASPGSTDDVSEGSVNKYYTAAKALADVTWSTLNGIPAWVSASTTYGQSLLAAANAAAAKTLLSFTKSDIGLGNVDNTSDAGKPISTATQSALDLKAPLANPTFTGTVGGISKSMVGLGNVDNTSDASKPVSTAVQAALDAKSATTHGHGNLTSGGSIGTTSGQIVVTTTGGVLTTAATISAGSVNGLANIATTGSAADLTDTLLASRLPASGVSAGTYTSVTVDTTGRVTAGSNPSSGGKSLGLILALT